MKLSARLFKLRKKFPGVTQTEMAEHFGLKLRQYQKYETGEAEPEEYKSRRIIQRIELLERLEKLPPLQGDDKPPPTDKDALIAELRETIRIQAMAIEGLTMAQKLQTEEIERLKNKPSTRQHA